MVIFYMYTVFTKKENNLPQIFRTSNIKTKFKNAVRIFSLTLQKDLIHTIYIRVENIKKSGNFKSHFYHSLPCTYIPTYFGVLIVTSLSKYIGIRQNIQIWNIQQQRCWNFSVCTYCNANWKILEISKHLSTRTEQQTRKFENH